MRRTAGADGRGAFSVGLRVITLGSAGMLLVITLLQGIPEVRAYGFLLASFVIASCYHALCAHFVRTRGDTALFAAQGLFNTALFIGLNVLFLAVFQWGIRGYVLSTTVANLVTTLVLIRKAQLWRYVQLAPKSRLRRQMLRYCIPLIPTAIFWWVMGVSDRYMVKWFLGSDANGIYAVAYKIPTILTILASIFMDAWQLSAIAESSGDRRAHLRFYGRIWDLFAADVFLGAGGIVALSPLLIRILADEPYYPAWRYIPMLTLSMAAAALSNFMGSVYVVTKKSAASFWTSLVGATANVLLNLWLIPWLGIQGAAATFFSCLAVFLIRLVNARLLLPFPLSGKKQPLRHGWFLLLGVAAVAALTLLCTGTGTLGSVNYAHLTPLQVVYIFFSGMVAITAMVLPGISGSSILLIAGVYLPTIQAIHSFLRLQLDVVPGLCALGFGVIAGVGLSIHAIRAALRSCRSQMVWLILGLMLGSLYAIANGPASLDTPLPPLDAATFQLPAFLLGTAILLALEGLKKATKRREQANGALQKGESLS